MKPHLSRIAIAVASPGLALAIWSHFVWIRSGYDCPIFAGAGPAAIVGWYFGLIIAIPALTAFVVVRVLLNRRANVDRNHDSIDP